MATTLNLDDEKNLALKRYLEQMNKSGPTAQENAIAEQAAADRRSNAYVAQMADAASLMGATAGGSQADTSGFRKGLEQMSAASDAEAQRRLAGIQQQRQGEMSVNKYLADKFENRQMKEGEYAQQEKLKKEGMDWDREKLDIENKNKMALEGMKYKNEMALAGMKGGGFQNLPKENQEMITKLTEKNANKISIGNQMESYLNQYRNAKTEEAKVAIGRSMLKVLNSPEGADAIGAEEAKRLGDALEYNIFSDQGKLSMRMGRELDRFDTQVVDTLNSVRQGVNKNNDLINKAKSGVSISGELQPMASYNPKLSQPSGTAMAADKSAQQYTQADYDAYNDLLKNPTAPGSDELRQHLQRIGLIDKMKNQMGGQQIYGGQ